MKLWKLKAKKTNAGLSNVVSCKAYCRISVAQEQMQRRIMKEELKEAGKFLLKRNF